MQTLRTVPHHCTPQRQRGLLGLLASLTIAQLMSLRVLVVDLEQLRVVRAELRKGMAACETDASGDTLLQPQ